ncbi:hypothetical protein C9374_014243 [Naegleria lovaniensis]|uniref:Uncharacterized protein n=1 Tax=Naegleria lovaniensis TaxID=51637 RepID=A0AA88GAW4_NAELO|nr:uncharacterized protein C9374_014243 [Naegleria lovaniensis]KAG2370785.1 hypothetical protein C9374_014243 [Naegleria lovaniensis]
MPRNNKHISHHLTAEDDDNTSAPASTETVHTGVQHKLLSSSIPLVFQKSTRIKGKNKYWQFFISSTPAHHMSDSDNDHEQQQQTHETQQHFSNSFYIFSRYGTTTLHPQTHHIRTTKGISYQKEFPSELQAQKELLIRIHGKLKEGYQWVYERKKRKFPMETLVNLVNDQIQHQFELFQELSRALLKSQRNQQQQIPRSNSESLSETHLPQHLRNISLPREYPNLPTLNRKSPVKRKKVPSSSSSHCSDKVPIIEFSSESEDEMEDDDDARSLHSSPPRVARRRRTSSTTSPRSLKNTKRNSSMKRTHKEVNSCSSSSESEQHSEEEETITLLAPSHERTNKKQSKVSPQKKKTKRNEKEPSSYLGEDQFSEETSAHIPTILLTPIKNKNSQSSVATTSTITPLRLSPIPYRSRRVDSQQQASTTWTSQEEGLDHDSSDDDDDEHDNHEFYGQIIPTTPERFKSTDTPVGENEAPTSSNVTRPLSDIDSGSDREDSMLEHLSFGGFGEDMQDISYSSTNIDHTSSALVQELEEKIKKLSQTITIETERANALDLEKNYLEKEMYQLVELHQNTLSEKDRKHEEEISSLKLRIEELSHFAEARQEELLRKEEALRELEKKLEEERIQLNQQREMTESMSQDLSYRLEQVRNRESLLEMREKELQEKMKQLESEQILLNIERSSLREQVNTFETEKVSFMQDMEHKNTMFEKEVTIRFQNQQQELEVERQRLSSEHQENMQRLNQEKETLRANQMEFELTKSSNREWYESKRREIAEKESEIENKRYQLEKQLESLTDREYSLHLQKQQHEELIFKRNSDLDIRENSFQTEKEKFEKERHAFNQLFEKRMQYENRCQQLGLALSQKHTEFQSALSIWLSALNNSEETVDDNQNDPRMLFSGANLDSDV